MHMATLMLIILSAGLASQWLAWRLRLPGIVILITTGLFLGPIFGIIEITMNQTEFTELIGFGVAIILFEGGMNLKFGEFRRVGFGVSRLTILGPPLAWLFGALSARYILGIGWPVASVLGAILVVTGPTVITPLLRQARLNKESASLLKWEGIVNDPIGVLLAVLAFQYFTLEDSSWFGILMGLGKALLSAGVIGGLGGWITGWLYRRGSVPEHLKAPMLMVLVLVAYWGSNLIQHEAGLLTVTVMGLVIGNMHLVEREPLRDFKENLTIVLLAVLFVIIPSQLKLSQLELITKWEVGLFTLAVLFVIRPLSIWIATFKASIRTKDIALLSWVAPRGIVAAATASIFGPAMVRSGYAEAEILLPLCFLIILVTVVAHGLTLAPIAKKLKLAAAEKNGLMIVGASDWTHALASALQKLEVEVLVVDGSYNRLKPIRMDGIETYYGEVLSEHAEHELEHEHLSYLLCATDNHYYSALVCKALGHEFGHHRTFQLAPQEESNKEQKRLTLQQRGYFAFEPPTDFQTLHKNLDSGWQIQSSTLSDDFTMSELQKRLGDMGEDWILLGSLSPKKEFQLYSNEQPFVTDSGWTMIYFSRTSL